MLDLLFPFLLRCPVCEGAPARECLPWCETCRSSLQRCPPLCPGCAGVGCPPVGPCSRPWRLFAPELPRPFRIEARYLLVGAGYRLLRDWKRRPGRSSSRFILSPDPSPTADWPLGETPVLVPVPQHRARSWRLGHHPAGAVAEWLGRQRGLAVVPALELGPQPGQAGTRQARLNREARLSQRFSFRLAQGQPVPAHAVVVDDFLTTGLTARAAAQALRAAGTRRVDFYFLGFRPELSRSELTRPEASRPG